MRNYQREEPKQKIPPPPKNWRFTTRDQEIVMSMVYFEGFLSVPQVQDLFFQPTVASQRRARKRLDYMWGARYLDKAPPERRGELPETIYWLAPKGAEFVAAEWDRPLKQLPWVKQPRFVQIRHDLMINEFHKDVIIACRQHHIEIEEWRPSYWFRKDADEITYLDPQGKQVKRRYQPDSYFVLKHENNTLRFLLEIDRGREGKEQAYRVFNEKILLTVPYIRSYAYERRFGHRSGRMLIVTSGMGRLNNLLERTIKHFDRLAQWYLFSTFDQVQEDTVITAPIWHSYKNGQIQKVSLLTG